MNFDDIFQEKKKICLSFSSTSIFLSLVSHNKQQNLIYFSDNYEHLFNLQNEIKLIDPKIKVVIVPEFDCNFFSNVSPTKEILSRRVEVFYDLIFSKNKKIIFLISIPSILQKVIPLNEVLKKKLIISDQDKHTYEKILEFLTIYRK